MLRIVEAVARQEPGLRWAAGLRDDGTILLVTDLAHGWVPSGVSLPEGVELLPPGRRNGSTTSLLGPVRETATYQPGDPFGPNGARPPRLSDDARSAPEVTDLGWELGEATHWRDGLPRLANTLAKAAAARTGVVEAEVELLRVYLDTARYQLLAQYPSVDQQLLLNCLLLAATEGLATNNIVLANYHFAWFRALSAPQSQSRWPVAASE